MPALPVKPSAPRRKVSAQKPQPETKLIAVKTKRPAARRPDPKPTPRPAQKQPRSTTQAKEAR